MSREHAMHPVMGSLCASLCALAVACGPSVTASQESAPWMLGVFSNAGPVPMVTDPYFTRYTFEERKDQAGRVQERTVEFRVVGLADYVQSSVVRRWEPRSAEQLQILPNEDEDGVAVNTLEWTLTADGPCGPFTVREYSKRLSTQEWTIIRGAVCTYELDHCNPDCPIEDPYPYARDWCDEPPPPCDEDASSGT